MNEFSKMNDCTLVEMTLLGKEDAFEELVTRHESAVRKSAYRVTGNSYSAEDASQDAFLAAWMKLDTLEDFALFQPWVCRIAANRARNLMAKYRRTIPDLSLDLEQFAEVADAKDREIAEIVSLRAGEVQDERLAAALDALSVKVREVVSLHYFDGLSVGEIASRLSLPAGTVKWRLSEGRKKLRKEYGNMERTYDENDTLVRRVMCAVEQLKLWRIRDDMNGFEEEYREVLSLVEELDDGEQKSHAAADVLLMGFWWLESEQSPELFERIKKEAENGHNEEVMSAIVQDLIFRGGRTEAERVENARKEIIPYLNNHGFRKPIGVLHCILAGMIHDKEATRNELQKALAILEKGDPYRESAETALEYLETADVNAAQHYVANTWLYRRIDGQLYFWSEGFTHFSFDLDYGSAVRSVPYFAVTHTVRDHRLWDETLKKGDEWVQHGRLFKVEDDGAEVSVKAGDFKGCCKITSMIERPDHISSTDEWYFCPGVGFVKYVHYSDYHLNDCVIELSSYSVSGEGAFPVGLGSSWGYEIEYDRDVIFIDYDKIEYKVSRSDEDALCITESALLRKRDGAAGWKSAINKLIQCCRRFTPEGYGYFIDPGELAATARAFAKTPIEKAYTEAVYRHFARRHGDTAVEGKKRNGIIEAIQYLELKRDGGRDTRGPDPGSVPIYGVRKRDRARGVRYVQHVARRGAEHADGNGLVVRLEDRVLRLASR